MLRAMSLSVLSSLSLAAGAAEPVKAPAPDPSVERLLEQLEYEYEVDEDGDYKLVFEMDGKEKRSQLVFVRSAVESFGAHRVREVWSPGYQAEGDVLPVQVANRLLEATQDNKLGAWAKQGAYAVFVVKLPADAGAEALDDAIDAAIRSADEMEAELTPGKDEF
jgi:hypothetical protein